MVTPQISIFLVKEVTEKIVMTTKQLYSISTYGDRDDDLFIIRLYVTGEYPDQAIFFPTFLRQRSRREARRMMIYSFLQSEDRKNGHAIASPPRSFQLKTKTAYGYPSRASNHRRIIIIVL